MQYYALGLGEAPAAHERFKPKAHATVFRTALQNAWEAFGAETADLLAQSIVAERLAQHLETLLPPEDLAFLERYGHVGEVTRCKVSLNELREAGYLGTRENFGIELPRPVKVHNGGQWNSLEIAERDRDAPMSAEKYAELSEQYSYFGKEGYAAYLEKYATNQRHALPEELVPYFYRLLEARKLYNADYKASKEFPSTYKAEHGVYPTWRDMESRFPVLGRYMARIRQVATDRTATTPIAA